MPIQTRAKNFKVSEDIVSRTVQGEEVIVDLTSGTYFGLNDTGTFVWKNILNDRSENEISEALSTEYQVDSATASKDTQKLIRSFESKGFVERV